MSLNGSYWFGVLYSSKDKYLGNLKKRDLKGKFQITFNIWQKV